MDPIERFFLVIRCDPIFVLFFFLSSMDYEIYDWNGKIHGKKEEKLKCLADFEKNAHKQIAC